MAPPQLELGTAVGVVLRAVVGGYALGLATETATEVEKIALTTEGPLVVTAVRVAGVVGPYGAGAMLCCTGLALVFLSAATGLALGARVTVLTAKAGWNPHVALVLVGVVTALGAVAGGAGLGAAVGVVTGEVLSKILCLVLFATEIAILIALTVKWEAKNRLKQMKMFLAKVFITMFMGVVLGLVSADLLTEERGDVLAPVLGLVVVGVILVPVAIQLGTVTERALGKIPGHRQHAGTFLGRLFGKIVALSGYLLGAGAGKGWQTAGVQPLMVTLLHSLAPVALHLAGVVGAALGTVTLGLAEGAKAEGVSVWVCSAVWVLLKALQAVAGQWSTGIMAGALLGASGAAGLSLGAVGVATGAQFGSKGMALAVLGAAGGAVLGSPHKTMRTVGVTVAAASAPRLAGTKEVVMIYCEAAGKARSVVGTQDGAVIGSVALGSAALGSAILGGIGLWTTTFGTAEQFTVLVVSGVILIMDL
ncbi:hypothetical protein COCON_G00009920 [Conger conger]|uniref:Uncharacterized protein n=1 Tax=Conger conger TaxID=82655 RepID=A0A9Q1E2A8_CONCO|nr:hypothetical protein COCON_G00009920 [Conger conger]